MAVMRGSGVYSTEVDESFQSFDTVNLRFMVPMMTKKGEVGKLNTVSIGDFKKKVGYDIEYNGNYLGLGMLLGSVTQVDVFRMNKGAHFGNVAIFNDGTSYSVDGVEDLDVMEAAECLRLEEALVVVSEGVASTLTYAVNESIKPGSVYIRVEGTLIAVDDGLGEFTPETGYAGITGTVNYVTGDVALSIPELVSDEFPGLESTMSYIHDADLSLIVAMKTPGDWDKLAVRMSRYYDQYESIQSATAVSVTLPHSLSDLMGAYRLKDISGNIIATTGALSGNLWTVTGVGLGEGITGTVARDTKIVTLTLPGPMVSGGPVALIHEYIQNDPYYLVEVLRKVTIGQSTSYIKAEFAKVSFVETLDNYVENVTFENIQLIKVGPVAFTSTSEIDLLYGDDGSIPSAAEMNFNQVDPSSFNMICMNGVIGAAMVSAFIQYFEQYNKITLFDIPNVETFVAAKLYASMVYASKNALAYWVSDLRMVGNKEYSIYPSVNAALTYARMFRATGYLNYPPAGYQYAAVAAEKLLSTDAGINAAQLKIAKINYVTMRSAGPVIWEHRTRYAFESDLSYASTVVSLIALQSRCKAFADNFPFRFVTPEILIQLRSGLEAIMADYLQRGFIWMGDVVLPSFEEVKKSGARFMDIYCNVKFAEDGQEFTFNFHVKAKA
jgi:hypothetical protein